MRFQECPECHGKAAEPKKNKYNAKTTVSGGLKFASKREARRYEELQMAEMAGEVVNLSVQPVYPLSNDHVCVKYPNGRIAKYTADFEYFENGELVTEDVKSRATMTEAAKLRMAVFTAIYGREVRITE
jgi:hypothetical protein